MSIKFVATSGGAFIVTLTTPAAPTATEVTYTVFTDWQPAIAAVVGHALCFDYDAIAGLDHEARIRRLTAWVLAAEAMAHSYTLVIPQESIGPGLGSQHRHACLRALVLLPHAPA